MTQTTTGTFTELPAPSKKHATCAWCRENFDTITELIDHADSRHFDAESNATATRRLAA